MGDIKKAKGEVPFYTVGSTSYIDGDGELVTYNSLSSVMIGDQNDLTLLSDYPPCTIAYTAGFKEMWQLDIDGTWVEIGG